MLRTLITASALLIGATFGAAALPGGSPAQGGIASEAPLLEARGERHGWGHRGRHHGWDRGRHRGWYKHHNRRHGHHRRHRY